MGHGAFPLAGRQVQVASTEAARRLQATVLESDSYTYLARVAAMGTVQAAIIEATSLYSTAKC